MHIPDGYLSPETAAVMYAAALPFWYRATQKLKSLVTGRMVPVIAIFAAFSFVIMMFNVPIVGGTTAHAVGASLIAIVLGPWAAVLAVSVALAIQALFFGDGGILAFGANVFNMAIVLPFVAFYVYRLISGNAAINSSRRAIAGAVAGYVGINAAALCAAIELGIQPILFHDAAGHAIYFPYDVTVSIPAMLIGHLTLAGAVEAIVTGLVFAWLQRSNPELIQTDDAANAAATRLPRWAWGGLIGLIILTPIGLLAPGTAWGEWGREELQQLGLSYIPAGFDQWSNLWSAPLSDYDLPALNNPTIAYILSAVLGVALIVVVILALGWVIERITQSNRAQAA